MKWLLILIPLLILWLVLSGCSGKSIDSNIDQDVDIDTDQDIDTEIDIEQAQNKDTGKKTKTETMKDRYINEGLQGTGGRKERIDHTAPRSIKSDKITSFEYEFNSGSLLHRGQSISYMHCIFSIERKEDNAPCRVSGEGKYNNEHFDHEFTAPLSALDDLHALVIEYNLAAENGKVNTTIGIPAGLGASLQVEYASGEQIYARDNAFGILGSKANEALYDFFRSLARDAGKDFLHTAKEIEDFQNHIAGTWKNEDKTVTIELRDNTVKIYDGTELIVDTIYYREYDDMYSEQDELGRFGRYTRLGWRDGCIVTVEENGTETKFFLHR